MVGGVIDIRGIAMRYVLIGLLCLLVLQGCESGSGGSSVGSGPVQGQNRDGGDHGGGHGR